MLPDSLSESYKEYKADTNAFVTWLSITAISCGYALASTDDSIAASTIPLHEQSGGQNARLKGKARKEAKEARSSIKSNAKPQLSSRNHLVSLKELLSQAEFVAASKRPRVKVPLGTQYVLKRAIDTRRKCTMWFQNFMDDEESSEHVSNATHQHFTSILESAFKMLAPNFVPRKSSKKSPRTKSSPAQTSRDTVPPADAANRYEALELEELDEKSVDLLVEEATNITIQKAPGTKSGPETTDTYELKVGVKEELPLLVCCFLGDIHKLRDFIKQTWQSVADGQLNYMVASTVTNVALQSVAKVEKELLSIWPEPLHRNPYSSITKFVSSQSGHEGAPNHDGATLDDDYTYINTFVSLEKHVQHRPLNKATTLPYTIPVRGVYSRLGIKTPTGENWIAEDEILSLHLHELEIQFLQFEKHERLFDGHNSPTLDEITNALEDVPITNCIGFQNVFVGRVLLDIHKIMGDQIDNGWRDLRQRSARISTSLGLTWSLKFDPKSCETMLLPDQYDHPCQQIHEWGTEDIADAVLGLSLRIKEVVEENPLVWFKQNLLETLPIPENIVRAEIIYPSADPCFTYKKNPLYCGLECLYSSIRMHDVEIQSANFFFYFAGVAHIYNAVKQLGLIQGRWENLEAAMDIYLVPLFKGSLPTTKQQMYHRLCFVAKVPASKFAHDARRSDWGLTFANCESLFQRDELSTSLADYLELKSSAEQLLLAVTTSKKQGTSSRKREFTQIEKLEQLRDAISNLMPKFDLDLVTLSRKCKKLLVLIREALKSKANHKNMDNEREFGDIYAKAALMTASDVITYTYDRDCVAKCTCGHHKKKVAIIHGNDIETPDRMKIAAEVIEGFLEEANRTVDVEPFDVVAATMGAGPGTWYM